MAPLREYPPADKGSFWKPLLVYAGRLCWAYAFENRRFCRTFGSGYPGVPSTGVAGRGFPFVFWPLAWEDTGVTTYRHLNNSTEYGPYDNSSRPGGVMMTAAITTMYVTRDNTTFRILADNFTVNSLAKDIQERCRSMLAFPPIVTTYNHSIPAPKPRQAIQYYRASTVCLSLDGYNNTALFDNSTDTPLPTRINKSLLNCINSTIASSVPLVDSTSAALGSYRIFGSPGTGVSASSTMALLLFLVFWISTAF